MNVAIGGLCHCSCSFWYDIPERTRTMTEPSDSYIHNLGPTVVTVPVANINSSIGNIHFLGLLVAPPVRMALL